MPTPLDRPLVPRRRLAAHASPWRHAAWAARVAADGGYIRPRHGAWAELLHRTFAIDVLACPDCGGRLRLVATITDRRVIEKILAHLGLALDPPCPAPPRPPAGQAR